LLVSLIESVGVTWVVVVVLAETMNIDRFQQRQGVSLQRPEIVVVESSEKVSRRLGTTYS